MRLLVLGAGAGGGFPRWNCDCALCGGQRLGRIRALPRTQCSVALTQDDKRWLLLNASPDIATQLRSQAALHPSNGQRRAPIVAVVLTDAHLDHVSGLLGLRSGPPIELHATPGVFEDLTSSLSLLPALQNYSGVHWHLLPVAGEQRSANFRVEGFDGLSFEALAVEGRSPPYSARRDSPAVGDHIALKIVDARSGQRLFFAPSLARIGAQELDSMRSADCVLVDGSFWANDDLIAGELDRRRASDLGHLPLAGGVAGMPGMIEVLRELRAKRKVLIHIDHSNPVLDEDSGERRELTRWGIEVAHDGMEIRV